MKLSDDAKQTGVRYETAWRWVRDGKIQGRRVGLHTIMSTEGQEEPARESPQRVAIYARASSAENKSTVDSQAERLVVYCTARGYQVVRVVKEVGSGIHDARPKLLALLTDQSIGLIFVEHQDRLTRFGFRYLDTLLTVQGCATEVVNQAENGTDDVLADLTAIVYSFCARLYGQRRAKRKTEVIVRELETKGESARGKPMQLVERHVIQRADPRFKPIDAAAFASKNLYNTANYVVRQSFIHEGVSLTYHEMHRRMKDHEAYQKLPAKVAQWVLRLLDKNWQSFFEALLAWQADPSKFLGRPKLPGYKDKQKGRNLLVYTIQALSAVETKHTDIQQVRIVPRHSYYVVEVIYEQAPIQAEEDPALRAGGDIGFDN